MAFFGGLAAGYTKALTEDRHLQAQQDEARANRENAALQHLTTSDDPEIASMALTGLLNQQRKPSKGLRGFFNETEGNPMLPTIRELMAKGKQVPNAGAPTPDAPPQGEVPAGIAEDSAALPAGSPVEPQGPRMSAATAPPGPVQFHEGPSVGTHTVPRQAFLSAGEKAGAIAKAQLGAKFGTDLEYFIKAAAVPGAQQAMFPGARPTGSHFTKDDYGNVTVTDAVGNFLQYLPAVGTTARPTGPQATTDQQVAAYQAANPGVDEATARTAVLKTQQGNTDNKTALGRAQATTAQAGAAVAPQMNAARLEALRNTALAAHQRATGTTPMTDAQRWTAARMLLGPTNPDVSPDDVEQVYRSMGGQGGGGTVATPPPGAAPGAATPPPAGVAGAKPSVVPAAFQGQARTPKAYSPQGKRTIQSIETARPLLQKLISMIEAEGLQDNGDIVDATQAGIAKRLQNWGVSPGTLQTEMMQLASVAEVAGFSNLTVGRLNLPVQEILRGHLTDAGDSYKVLYDKARGMLEKFPDIEKAVGVSENLYSGKGRGRPGAAPPAAHPNSALPDGTEFQGPDGLTYVKTGTNPDGTIRTRLKVP